MAKVDVNGSLIYSTYLGGTASEQGNSIAVDTGGNTYVTGTTTSANFPTTFGAFDTLLNGDVDAFITKLDATGANLVYSTFLGGGSGESGQGIAVDATGNAYVTGDTLSGDFPTTAGVFDTSFNGGDRDVFVVKLDAAGANLQYATYLGGSGLDRIPSKTSIGIDTPGNVYVTGLTKSNDFPTTFGAFDTSYNGGEDLFVTKLDVNGASLLYSTYLGGSGNEFAPQLAADSSGNAHVTGQSASADFPTTAGAFDTLLNGPDAFVAKLDATGASLVYSTYLGGSSEEGGSGIAVDPEGNAYVT